MTLLVATPKRLGSRLRVLRPKLGDAPVIAFRAEPVWKADPTLAVGDRRFAVRACPSGLAVQCELDTPSGSKSCSRAKSRADMPVVRVRIAESRKALGWW